MRKLSVLLVPAMLGWVGLVPVLAAQGPVSAIEFTNYSGGETIRYPVPLIRGTLADKSLTSVEVTNETSNRDTARMKCLALRGRFKALTELVPGKNRIIIKAGKDSRALELTYQLQTNPSIVRVIFATDSTRDTTYQTPIANDPQNYAETLGAMMILMQTFTAESMNDLGMGCMTFNLPHARNGWDITRRGGDFFSRFWVLEEAPVRGAKGFCAFEDNRAAQWTLGSAAFLRASPWLALDQRSYPAEEHIQARQGQKPGEIIVASSDGIGGVCLGSPGNIVAAVEMDWLKPAPKEVVVDTTKYEKALEGPKGWLRVVDVNGHVNNIYVKDVLPGWGQGSTQPTSAKAQ